MTHPTAQIHSTNVLSDLLDQHPPSSPTPVDDRLLSALTHIEQCLQVLKDNQRLLTTQFETLASDPPIVTSASTPYTTNDYMDAFLSTKLNDDYRAALDSFSHLSASVAEVKSQQSSLQATSSSTIQSSGFFQKESKDFHVSKLVKLLTNKKLGGDSLQDLE